MEAEVQRDSMNFDALYRQLICIFCWDCRAGIIQISTLDWHGLDRADKDHPALFGVRKLQVRNALLPATAGDSGIIPFDPGFRKE